MGQPMARERTVSRESARILVLHSAPVGRIRGCDDRQIEVNQAAVVHRRPLTSIDPVGIMADAARRSDIHDVQTMPREALITKNTVAIIATRTTARKNQRRRSRRRGRDKQRVKLDVTQSPGVRMRKIDA